jgi:hypothetical protein
MRPVDIGDRVVMGPNVQIYSGGHLTDPTLRNGAKGPEFGKPITIGNDVWIGGAVVIWCVRVRVRSVQLSLIARRAVRASRSATASPSAPAQLSRRTYRTTSSWSETRRVSSNGWNLPPRKMPSPRKLDRASRWRSLFLPRREIDNCTLFFHPSRTCDYATCLTHPALTMCSPCCF